MDGRSNLDRRCCSRFAIFGNYVGGVMHGFLFYLKPLYLRCIILFVHLSTIGCHGHCTDTVSALLLCEIVCEIQHSSKSFGICFEWLCFISVRPSGSRHGVFTKGKCVSRFCMFPCSTRARLKWKVPVSTADLSSSAEHYHGVSSNASAEQLLDLQSSSKAN